MSIEQGSVHPVPIINPQLNPAYWQGHYLGDGTAQPRPDLGRPGQSDHYRGLRALAEFAQKGGSRLASSRLLPGDTFNASDYAPGSVLLTLAEYLRPMNKTTDMRPMQDFSDVPVPLHPASIADGDQERLGHGYRYTAQPLINLVVGKRERKVLVVPDTVVGDRPDVGSYSYRLEIIKKMQRGFLTFVIGKTYNFGNNNDPRTQALARVTEAIVCMEGGGVPLPSLSALWKARTAFFSSRAHPNPKTA